MDLTEQSTLLKLYKESISNHGILMIATTVDTGFEWQAIDECREKLQIKNAIVAKERGKIYFNVPKNDFTKVQEMRSIDNILIIGDVRRFKFDANEKEKDLQEILDVTRESVRLEKALNAWKDFTGFMGKIYPTKEEFQVADEARKKEEQVVESTESKGRKRGQDPSTASEKDVLRFRVTCERTGKHSFESGNVARIVGGELQEKYLWLVDLVKYHLEIVCKLIGDEMVTALRVTHVSKHRRNITNFGPTTLRATICYNLLRLANPHPGDVVIDPMCGGGSIPIEATLAFKHALVLCGDNHSKAVERSKLNIQNSASGSKIDLMQWSVEQLPFKDSSVDIIVSDMPFGKRSGTMSDNRILYKQLLVELGRVVRLSSGRMVLLTYDRRSFNMALQAAGNLFWVTKMLGVNIGGLQAAVYVLKRTDILYTAFTPKQCNSRKRSRSRTADKSLPTT